MTGPAALGVPTHPRPTQEGASSGLGAESALVRVAGLVKRFPRRRPWLQTLAHPFRQERIEVLRGVSLEVREGEFFGLLGPNGAGKTTLFKILATLVLPDDGGVTVAGRDALADPAAVRSVLTPVIAEERSLAWRLSAFQNMQLYAALYGVPRAEQRQAAERLLETVGLGDTGTRMVGTFSSGMKQRLLIARALLSKPRVLLLDEPTRSLDPVSARDFRRFLREEIVARQGCTVLLATHDADEAFELCDRLAVLNRGVVIARGTVGELARLAGENRYRLLVTQGEVPRARAVAGEHGVTAITEAPSEDAGWTNLEGAVPGGTPAAAELTKALTAQGIAVAEIARVPLSLADMIERLVAREGR